MSKRLKIMVGSTIYKFENELSAIVATLETLGYDVISSYAGTVKVNPHLSNLDNCIKAVGECDLFLGIIRPFYGTGNIGEKNITFEEMKEAVRLNKPYWFLAHRDVTFCRQLQRKLTTPIDFNFKKKDDNKYFFDARTLDIYDFAIKSYEKDVANRTGNWVQEFYRLDEILKFITSQFADTERIEQIIKEGGSHDFE
jgi:hypothetical protein